MEMLRLRLLVGKIEEESSPVVAASIDESIYDVIGEDDPSWQPAAVRASWPSEYEWREVIVRIPTQLIERHFVVPEIVGFPEPRATEMTP